MPLSDSIAGSIADLILQAVPIANVADNAVSAPLTNLYVGGATAYVAPGNAANTNELSYTGYARAAVPRSAAGWTRTSRTTVNDAQLQLGQRSDAGAAQEMLFWHLSEGSSGASIVIASGPVGAARKLAIGADISGELLTCVSHGFAADDRVVFTPPAGASLPTGITEGTIYWVRSGGLTTDLFTISATQGGAAVNISVTGNAFVTKLSPVSVTQNINPTIAIGAISIVI